MAKNQNTTSSTGGLMNFYTSIRGDPHKSVPVSTAHNNGVRIGSEYSKMYAADLTSAPRTKEIVFVGRNNDIVEKTDIMIQGSKLEKQETLNDKFSGYIKRVKNRMRSSSSTISATKAASRPDSFNENVSRYIRRAKVKIRRSSSVGDGKSVTFK